MVTSDGATGIGVAWPARARRSFVKFSPVLVVFVLLGPPIGTAPIVMWLIVGGFGAGELLGVLGFSYWFAGFAPALAALIFVLLSRITSSGRGHRSATRQSLACGALAGVVSGLLWWKVAAVFSLTIATDGDPALALIAGLSTLAGAACGFLASWMESQ